MSIPDGGPAFPQVQSEQVGSRGDYHTEISSIGGMTLRDFFAGQALAGMLASEDNVVEMDEPERAHYAYLQADAMILQRSKGTGT